MAKTEVCSYSELDTYRQCRFKHQLAYRERWQSDEVAPALSRGTLFHAVMEAHYRGLQRAQAGTGTLDEVRAEILGLLYDEETAQQTEEQALVEWMFRGYLSHYKQDALEWDIVDVERRLEEYLPTEHGGRSRIKLAGTIDLLVRDRTLGGGLWIVDHKTCKDLPRDKDLDMEDQTGIYAYLLRRAGLDMRGAIYNHVRHYRLKTREMEPSERFRRTITVRSDKELETIALEALDLLREAHRRGGNAPRSPNSDTCRWKCGFTEACLAGRRAGDVDRTREFLEATGFARADAKPGPTFRRMG